MKIRWNRIAAAFLGLVVITLITRHWIPLMSCVATVRQVGSPYSFPEERHMGFITLALVTVLIVAVVKLLVQSGGRDK